MVTPTAVFVQVESEGGTYTVIMTKEDAARCKKLLKHGEWHDEVNDILDRSPRLEVAGVLNTSGDMCGWGVSS